MKTMMGFLDELYDLVKDECPELESGFVRLNEEDIRMLLEKTYIRTVEMLSMEDSEEDDSIDDN